MAGDPAVGHGGGPETLTGRGWHHTARDGTKKGTEQLILGLAEGLSLAKAAQRAGLSRRTACRRAADPGVRQRIQEVRSQLFGRAVGRLAGLSVKAGHALGPLRDSGTETVRLAAARAILDLGPRLGEAAEVAQRVEELERRLAREEKP